MAVIIRFRTEDKIAFAGNLRLARPMKKSALLLSLLLAISVSARASTDDPTDPSSANLINLNYYLRPGLVLAEPSVSSEINSFVASTDISFVAYELFLEYGLPVDGLRVAVSATDSVTAYSNSGGSYYYSGLSDPTIQLNYRFYDSTATGWSVDGQLDFTPGFGTHYRAEYDSPGTDANGYSGLTATAAAFWRLGQNEARFTGSLFHRFSGSATNVDDSDNDYTLDSGWQGSLEVTDRFHFCSKLYVEGLANFIFQHSFDYIYSDGTVTDTIPFNIVPELQIGYLASKQLVLEAHVKYEGYEETDDATSWAFRQTSWGMSASIEF